MADKLEKLRKRYPDYTFLYPPFPRPEKFLDRKAIDELLFHGRQTIITNPAEDEMYIDLTQGDAARVFELWPGLVHNNGSYVNFSYIQREGISARVLSATARNGQNCFEIGRVDLNGKSCYQTKLDDDPVQQVFEVKKMSLNFQGTADFMERTEDFLRANIPKYFTYQNHDRKGFFGTIRWAVSVINRL